MNCTLQIISILINGAVMLFLIWISGDNLRRINRLMSVNRAMADVIKSMLECDRKLTTIVRDLKSKVDAVGK